jgi:hypothetical protein
MEKYFRQRATEVVRQVIENNRGRFIQDCGADIIVGMTQEFSEYCLGDEVQRTAHLGTYSDACQSDDPEQPNYITNNYEELDPREVRNLERNYKASWSAAEPPPEYLAPQSTSSWTSWFARLIGFAT